MVEFDFVENVVRCNVNSLYGLLEALGLPTENKVQKKFLLPEWLMKAPLWQKRLFLAAFFGAELSSPKTVTKHGYNFYGPVLSMNKAERFIENGKEFLLQINSLLKEFPVRNIGPTVQGGRIVDVEVNLKNPKEFYVGYASGGIFKTKK